MTKAESNRHPCAQHYFNSYLSNNNFLARCRVQTCFAVALILQSLLYERKRFIWEENLVAKVESNHSDVPQYNFYLHKHNENGTWQTCFALCPYAASLLGKGFLGCLTSQSSFKYVMNLWKIPTCRLWSWAESNRQGSLSNLDIWNLINAIASHSLML